MTPRRALIFFLGLSMTLLGRPTRPAALADDVTATPQPTEPLPTSEVWPDTAQASSTAPIRGIWDCWSKAEIPEPCRLNLYGLELSSASDGWAVGTAGTTLHWDGVHWTKVPNPYLYDLYSVSSTDANHAWAVGYFNDLLFWDGKQWNYVDIPSYSDYYWGVEMVSPNDVWVVGRATLHWDGIAWTKVTSPVGGNFGPVLRSIDMLSATDGWAAGDGAVVHWDGTAWTLATPPVEAKVIDMLSPNDGWVIGSSSISHWNGQSWTETPLPAALDDYVTLKYITMLSPTEGWVVGTQQNSLYGFLLQWDGVAWSLAGILPESPLSQVKFASANDGWAVGSYGALIHYNGWNWQTVQSVRSTKDLTGVTLSSSTDGWAVGADGTLLHWDGRGWHATIRTPLSTSLSTHDDFLAVDATSANDAWAVTYNSAYHWNGRVWRESPGLPRNGQLMFKDIDAVSPTDVWIVGAEAWHWDGQSWSPFHMSYGGYVDPLLKVRMLTSNYGWAIGSWVLNWDGTRWTPSDSAYGGDALDILSPTDAWAFSGSSISHWDGARWTRLPYTGLYEVADVSMLSAGEGLAVGNATVSAGGALYWNGSAWTPVGLPTAQALRGVSMVTPRDGWAVGDRGTILRWNGERWLDYTEPDLSDLYEPILVEMLSPTEGWLVDSWLQTMYRWDGETWSNFGDLGWPGADLRFHPYDLYVRSAHEIWVAGESASARWNGTAWTTFDFPEVTAGTTPDMQGIDFTSSTDGWAVGRQGQVAHWNGTNWTNVATPTQSTLLAVDLVEANEGWAVGVDRVILRLHQGQWSVWQGPQPPGTGKSMSYLSGIQMVSASDGWAVGGRCYLPSIGSPRCNVVAEHWDGTTWTEDPDAASIGGTLDAVSMPSPGEGWAGGFDTIARWDGTAWTRMPTATLAKTGGTKVTGIATVSEREVWAAADAGRILHYVIAPPTLSIDCSSAHPGSTVSIAGSGFPFNTSVTVADNGQSIAPSLTTDGAGNVAFRLHTDPGGAGFYWVSVGIGKDVALLRLRLGTDAAACASAGSGTTLEMPSGRAGLKELYIAMIQRGHP